MRVYIDTSVVLRVVYHHAGALATWGQWTTAYASTLWHTEALRAIDRARLGGAIGDAQVSQLRTDIEVIHDHFSLVPLTERILTRAGESFPTIIGTLDAIHLATAIHIRDTLGLDAFLTHDTQLATAAVASGFAVQGV
jgi:predicted nucleic acid-binding protein